MPDLLLPGDSNFPRSPDQYHQNSDVDSSVFAFHHTLGPKAHQAAPGNHRHRKATSYTPTWGGVLVPGNGSSQGFYSVIDGALVTFSTLFTLGSTSSISGSGSISCTLPSEYPLAALGPIDVQLFSASNNWFMGMHISVSSTAINFLALGNTSGPNSGANITATVPFTWKATDTLSVRATYTASF